ncbi:MAG: hypothetical protein JXA25_06600 [Anaerolineales bacterium]|nr:hypothetical protein [Anaerolineales bacterium]
MQSARNPDYIKIMHNQINITRVPFSDRGSRILLYQYPEKTQLFIKLAERMSYLDPALEAYLTRGPFITDLAFIDEDGKELAFTPETFPHLLRFHTAIGDFGIVFQDQKTLSFGLPDGKTAGIRFFVFPQLWNQTEQGGFFKAVRNLAYSGSGTIVSNRIFPRKGGYEVEFLIHADQDSTISLTIADREKVPDTIPFTLSKQAAEFRWRDWFENLPPVIKPYRQTYAYAWWIMASNLISPFGNILYEAMTPSKKNYIGLWLWDSAMHSLAYRHVDPELARNQIRAMISNQLPDGMLPDAVYDEGIIAEIDHPIRAEVTKPPILAWAALKLHEMAPDLEFLKEIYIPLVRWNAWWFSMNDDNVNGLVQYNHPYSSGLDNNPLWDFGMPVESPDLNTYLCVQMGSLAEMAELLGMDQEGAMWRRRAEGLVQRMIREFWDEEKGVFQALHNGEPVPVLTPFNLYPLWTGQLPVHITERLIAHLTNPDEFWGEYPIPSVALNDALHDPESMWRGPVWANINYFFIEALHQIGYNSIANTLCEKTLHMIMNHPSIYEFYNAKTGEPPESAAEVFGWTAAVFIDLAIQASEKDPSRPDRNESTGYGRRRKGETS